MSIYRINTISYQQLLNRLVILSVIFIAFLIGLPASQLMAQTAQSVSVVGDNDVEVGRQITYRAEVSGVSEECLVYRWKANGGTVVGSTDRPTFSVSWTESGDVTLALSPTSEGECGSFSLWDTLPVTVGPADLCKIQVDVRINCAVGYMIAGPIDKTKVNWTDGDISLTKEVKDGDTLELVHVTGPCVGQVHTYQVKKTDWLQPCHDCRDTFIQECEFQF